LVPRAAEGGKKNGPRCGSETPNLKAWYLIGEQGRGARLMLPCATITAQLGIRPEADSEPGTKRVMPRREGGKQKTQAAPPPPMKEGADGHSLPQRAGRLQLLVLFVFERQSVTCRRRESCSCRLMFCGKKSGNKAEPPRLNTFGTSPTTVNYSSSHS